MRFPYGHAPIAGGPSPTLATSDATPASPRILRKRPEVRGRRGAAIAARKRALSDWDKANPGAIYDPEVFKREILPKLRTVPLAEIIAAIGCSKASASDIRRGKRTPHVSAWRALAAMVDLDVLELGS